MNCDEVTNAAENAFQEFERDQKLFWFLYE
jgi:hypothetical protein